MSGGEFRLFDTLDHVDRFPRTILRAEFTAYAHLFINDDNSVHADVAMFCRILGARDLVKTIHGTKLDAHFTTCAPFRMYNCDNSRFFFLLDRRYCGGCGLLRRCSLDIAHVRCVGGVSRSGLAVSSEVNIAKHACFVKKKSDIHS